MRNLFSKLTPLATASHRTFFALITVNRNVPTTPQIEIRHFYGRAFLKAIFQGQFCMLGLRLVRVRRALSLGMFLNVGINILKFVQSNGAVVRE